MTRFEELLIKARTYVAECREYVRDCAVDCGDPDDHRAITAELIREHAIDCEMGCTSALESANIIDALLAHVASLEADAERHQRIENLLTSACRLIETGDDRVLATDGDVRNMPPILSLAEWRTLYTTLTTALLHARRHPLLGAARHEQPESVT